MSMNATMTNDELLRAIRDSQPKMKTPPTRAPLSAQAEAEIVAKARDSVPPTGHGEGAGAVVGAISGAILGAMGGPPGMAAGAALGAAAGVACMAALGVGDRRQEARARELDAAIGVMHGDIGAADIIRDSFAGPPRAEPRATK
jgi:hypothetical protein